MVKFQVYYVKKRCKPGRGPYKYRGILLRVPKKFHAKVNPLLGVDFEVQDIIVNTSKEKQVIEIVLSSTKCNIAPELTIRRKNV